MILQNSGEKRIIFRLSQFIQESNLLWFLAGAGILLVFLLFLLFWSLYRRKRKNARKESGAGLGHMTEDTAELPEIQNVWMEYYGFRVVEDITYVHTTEQIILEEDGDI